MEKTIGQVAYEKWVELIPTGVRLGSWKTLPETTKGSWEEIALAAVNQHIDDGMRDPNG
jgi:hypothetical protein